MLKNLIYLIIFLITVFLYIRYMEYRSLYFPMRHLQVLPDTVGLSFEDLNFMTRDGKKLNGWFLSNKDSTYMLLFCHGNGGNMSHRIEKLLILHHLGFEIFIFDYRGYGKSEGRPSERGLYQDSQAAYDYLVLERHIRPERIILYGESLGGAIAVDLVARKKVKALITEEAFSSTSDMTKVIFPFLPSFLVFQRYDSLSKIKKIYIQKLIIHSINDEIVPFKLAEKLFAAAAEPKTFLKLTGSHNTAFLDSDNLYREGISSWLKSVR